MANVKPKQIALPSKEYMEFVCGTVPDVEDEFLKIGEWLVSFMNSQGMIRKSTDFLDIGCGCARVARFLVNKPLNTYTGFDRHPGMIEWCQQEITSHVPHFKFDLFELKSIYEIWDNTGGAIDAASFQFPYADESFDSILLASVLTHMPLRETAHYLKEMYRVLRPKGKILLSVFVTDEAAHSDKIDFHYNRQHFVDAIESANLSYRIKRQTGPHTWFQLRKG